MGFDPVAKDRDLGEKGYFRANVYQMTLLRTAMVMAGVKENLVYKKFAGNDGHLVTPLQSKQIAESLRTWLKGRNLIVDLAEHNEAAKAANRAYLEIFEQLGNAEEKSTARYFSKSESIPFKLDSGARRVIREFADFCARSGGFGVE